MGSVTGTSRWRPTKQQQRRPVRSLETRVVLPRHRGWSFCTVRVGGRGAPASQQRAATVAGLLRLDGVSAATFKSVGFDRPLPPNPRNASNRVVVITTYPKN